jgi:ketosteroid isomerase-like protein
MATEIRPVAVKATREELAVNNRVTDARDFSKAFETALNDGCIEHILQLYDPNAAMRAPDNRISAGLEAVRLEMQGLISANARIENHLRYALVHGDTALIVVDWALDLSLPDGSALHQQGTATNVIRFDNVSGWRMIVANPYGVA